MPSSRWHTVQDALWKAIDLVPAAREAFLAEYCEGDPELMAEVCTLLDAHEEAGDFLGGTQPSAARSSTAEGGSRIRRLFQEVADFTPEERAAWVEAALPHEASLRREVNALLHVYERGFGAPRGEDAAPASDSLPHHTISHYRILEKLGAGGMGVVYRARDTRLDRVVALKFPRGGDGDGKARLIREARAASALDHANICTIHEIGETETGQVFIAMAYYAGETLERMLGRARLSIGDALVYAMALAQGLAKAHEQGIVHRDLKPANVMVTADGTVKLLDFGLAGVADGHVLPAGAVRATPAYMSPEQARGEPVDHRTDIWSLGATIYEMVTGSRPFRGIDAQAVVDGILNHAPSPLTVERPEVPGPLERTVSRALAKRPDERYATVLEMLEDLREARRLSVPDGVSGQGAHTEPATSRLLPGGERVHATAVVWALGGGAEGSPSGEDGPTAAPWAVACLTEVVRRHGGIVRQGRGKDIIALFGVPTPREDDCIRAARAALEVGGLLRERTAAAVPALRVGVGIDTGSVVAREPQRAGQPHRAAGRPLRLAARLARHAGADQVLASPGSARLLERLFETEDGPPLRRVGREDFITPARVVEETPSRGAVDFADSPGLSAFVGRNAEMATLLRSLRKAEAGDGQLVTVSGEAGLGKSRLLHEFRNRLGAKGVQAVQGRCSARSAYRPFQPFVGALQDWLDFRPDGRGRSPPGPVVDRIRRLAPELVTYAPLYLHLLSVPSEDHPLPKHVAGESLHRILVKALAAIFTLSARHRPLVLLLDDWQWSDPASRDVLEQMIELSPGYPLLLVVTFRPEYQPAWPQPAHQATVRLQALDEKASIRLMHSALQAEHLPQDAASSFHDRSGGNPFFLEEICRSLLEEGTLRIEGGRAIAARSLENLILPNTVQAVIRTRLHRLGSRERTVLCMASVIGRTFTRDLLEHALRGTSGMLAWLDRSLEALRSAGLIYRTHLLPEATYRFRHVLTLEAGYNSLLLHQRRRAHSLVGLAIEERSSARLEEQAEVLAHHFGEARDWRKRVRYSRLAGERSYRLGQIAQAIALHEQAREALDRLPDDSERRQGLIDLLLRQERLYEAAGGRRPAQQAAIDELLALLGSDRDPDALVEVHVRQADLHILAGCFERAETALDEALAISRRHGSITGEQRALRGIGFLRWHQDRHGEALTVNEELVTLDRERGDAGALLTDLLNLLTVLKRVGDFERGRACADELLRLGQDLQDPAKLLPVYNNLAEFHRALGDGARALSFVERALGAAAELKFLGPDTYQRTMRAQILLDQGRVEESIRCYMEVIDLHRREHAAQGAARPPHASGLEGLADIQRTLGEILVGLGRVEEGLPYLEESASAYGTLESAEREALLRSRVAAVCEGQRRFGRAASEWVRVAALCQRSRDLAGESRAREGQGRVARRLEDDEGAESSYREALRLAVSAGDETRQGALHNTLGILAWHRQAYDQALQHYEQALAIYRRRGEPAHVGHGLASIGLTLHRLHRSEEAVRRLEEAIRLERQHDLRQLEAYALGTLGDVRLSMGDDDEAVLCYEQSLRVRLAIGDRRGEGWMLLRLAGVHATRGRGDRSRTNAARAAAIAAEIGDGELANGCASLSGSAATPGAFGA